MSYRWHDLVGNVGVAMILIAYLLVQLGRTDARDVGATLANAVGAGLIVVSLSFDFNLSAFVVEFVWCLISLFGLGRALRTRRATA